MNSSHHVGFHFKVEVFESSSTMGHSMSPLNITQPLGIWSIMATISWCPIYPKWDSYQPLLNQALIDTLFQMLGVNRSSIHSVWMWLNGKDIDSQSNQIKPSRSEFETKSHTQEETYSFPICSPWIHFSSTQKALALPYGHLTISMG